MVWCQSLIPGQMEEELEFRAWTAWKEKGLKARFLLDPDCTEHGPAGDFTPEIPGALLQPEMVQSQVGGEEHINPFPAAPLLHQVLRSHGPCQRRFPPGVELRARFCRGKPVQTELGLLLLGSRGPHAAARERHSNQTLELRGA